MSLRSQVLTPAPAATKIRLAMLSSALADALGGPCEFQSRFSFDFVSEMIPNQNFSLGPGIWTDDTSMTLALARSIATFRDPNSPNAPVGGFDEADQLDAYYRWWKEGVLSATGYCFDIGNTISRALRIYADLLEENALAGPRKKSPLRKLGEALSFGPGTEDKQREKRRELAFKALEVIKSDLGGSAFGGNGSLMRILPVGLAYYRHQDKVKDFAARSAAVTHPNAVPQEASSAWAEIIAKVVRCAADATPLTKLDVLHHFASYSYRTPALKTALTAETPYTGDNDDTDALEAHYAVHHPVFKLVLTTAKKAETKSGATGDLEARILALLPQAAALRSSGYVVHTLTAALYAFLATKTFEDGVLLVVNMGDDADTVAAVFGGLAGAWYASENDANFWTERVKEWREGYLPPSRTASISSRTPSLAPSLSDKYHLAPDPAAWGSNVSYPEPDDALHDPRGDHHTHNVFTGRGLQNVGCIFLLCLCIVGLFLGYPLTTFLIRPPTVQDRHVNATGQVPQMPGNWGLIDEKTPKEFYKIHGYHDPGDTLELVFSDEFETAGRSFYPGDDPYWEAVDLHYWATNNLEWYDPSMLTTENGYLSVKLAKVEDISTNHNLAYKGGMMATWNKFCFTGGVILSSVMLPGTTNVFGLWPAIWTMGNLGRAGYGATLEGMWPYSYDQCDVGTMPNQTLNDGPEAAISSGEDGGPLSFLPGQRLSRASPDIRRILIDNDFRVRVLSTLFPRVDFVKVYVPWRISPGACSFRRDVRRPFGSGSIDVFEAQIGGPDGNHVGQVSQSAQWAPFNAGYAWDNSSDVLYIASLELSHENSYRGGVFQQASSVVSTTNQDCYQLKSQCFAVQGFEYKPGYDDAYITWITDNKVSWTMTAGAVGADDLAGIKARPITEEPLYIIINLVGVFGVSAIPLPTLRVQGISRAFGFVDFERLTFPAEMRVDWVRVYQHPDRINIGCDPPERPTASYINTYETAYTNPNLTTWVDDYGQPFPKNNLKDQC
ncbi:GH16 domain-containing protein [Mycena kentingensis (nom. inval.)]|nr:GH16 domain-containing protein [Mycena kentingensis (nom. inval.)]